MKIVATRTTAFVTGIWTTVSLSAFSSWTPRYAVSPGVTNLTYLLAPLVLWVAPLVLFVYGFDRRRWKSDYMFGPEYQAEFPELIKRGAIMVCGRCRRQLGAERHLISVASVL